MKNLENKLLIIYNNSKKHKILIKICFVKQRIKDEISKKKINRNILCYLVDELKFLLTQI